MPTPFQDVHEPDQIRVHVGVGILDRIPDPRLGGEMDHPLRFFPREEGFHAGPVRQIQTVEAKTPMVVQPGQSGLLETDVVVVVEVVEPDDFVAPPQQQFGGVETDEPGRAGHEDFHRQN